MAERLAALRSPTRSPEIDVSPKIIMAPVSVLSASGWGDRHARIDLAAIKVAAQQPRIRLTYRSDLVATSEVHAREIITAIMNVACRENTEQEIGGALHFNPSSRALVQIIEGPGPAVKVLLENIRGDTRHAAVKVLSEEALEDGEPGRFSSFGMYMHESTSFVAPSLVDDGTRLQPSDHLVRLTYVSVMTAESTAVVDSQMAKILDGCLKHNPARRIGGVISCNPLTRQVMQELEGPEAEVLALFALIKQDKRHTAVTQLSHAQISSRVHPWFGMVRGIGPAWKVLRHGGMRQEFLDL